MVKQGPVRVLMLALAFNLIPLGVMQSAHAGVIGSDAYASVQARAQHAATVQAFLGRDVVRGEMIRQGVDADAAAARVAALTDAELAALAGRIDSLPAGGDGAIAIIGVVFLVLLVLEVVGVTDLFKGV